MIVRLHPPLTILMVATVISLTSCGSDIAVPLPPGQTLSSLSGTVNAEGSTAQKNAITQVIADFQITHPHTTINYHATGSGAGVKQFIAGHVDFAGTDSALKTDSVNAPAETAAAAQRCKRQPAWHLPLAAGPISIAYHLPGQPQLTLTAPVLARIFTGKITRWNDPSLTAINPGALLPDLPIVPFYRSDESGTSENVQKYLTAAAGQNWPTPPSKQWAGTAGEGKPKSAGVSAAVTATAGGVTYVEWSFAQRNKLTVARIDNGSGPVTLSGDSAGKALTAAKRTGSGNDIRLSLDYATRAPDIYPIVLVTYEVVCSAGNDPAVLPVLKEFLTFFASAAEQNRLNKVGFAPLPDEIRTAVTSAVRDLR